MGGELIEGATLQILRDAVRLLCILYYCGEPKQQLMLPFTDNDDYTRCIDSEVKLQKLDFWVRYPDHLAAALLNGCESSGALLDQMDDVRQTVQRIFRDDEPTIRVVPMQRYLRGAYEPLDTVLVFLISRWLAYQRVTRARRTQYFLTVKGHAAVEALLRACPETAWYADRCHLLNRFFGHLSGEGIRSIQYLEPTYAAAANRTLIPSVEQEVRDRFARLFGEVL
jgi:hypothetical protein